MATPGNGVINTVLAMRVNNYELIVGGSFETAGDRASLYIARWNRTLMDIDGDGCDLMGYPASGDLNCDGGVNIGDAVYLINHIFNGGLVPCADCP